MARFGVLLVFFVYMLFIRWNFMLCLYSLILFLTSSVGCLSVIFQFLIHVYLLFAIMMIMTHSYVASVGVSILAHLLYVLTCWVLISSKWNQSVMGVQSSFQDHVTGNTTDIFFIFTSKCFLIFKKINLFTHQSRNIFSHVQKFLS